MSDEWHKTHTNLVELAEWLADECVLNSAEDAVRFFEKPWKWTREWGLYEAWLREGESLLKERLVEALTEGDQTADQVIAELEEEEKKQWSL